MPPPPAPSSTHSPEGLASRFSLRKEEYRTFQKPPPSLHPPSALRHLFSRTRPRVKGPRSWLRPLCSPSCPTLAGMRPRQRWPAWPRSSSEQEVWVMDRQVPRRATVVLPQTPPPPSRTSQPRNCVKSRFTWLQQAGLTWCPLP